MDISTLVLLVVIFFCVLLIIKPDYFIPQTACKVCGSIRVSRGLCHDCGHYNTFKRKFLESGTGKVFRRLWNNQLVFIFLGLGLFLLFSLRTCFRYLN